MSDCGVVAFIRSGRESKTSSLPEKEGVYFLVRAVQRAQMQRPAVEIASFSLTSKLGRNQQKRGAGSNVLAHV